VQGDQGDPGIYPNLVTGSFAKRNLCTFSYSKALIMAPTPRGEKPMPAKKYTKSIHVGLTAELLASIRLAAMNRKTTASELIRSAIERELGIWPLRSSWTAAEVMKVFREEDR
jgi:hypothetical protein